MQSQFIDMFVVQVGEALYLFFEFKIRSKFFMKKTQKKKKKN